MRKRQIKKFAKNAKKNLKPYRDANNGGSKKLDRRRKAFGRYWTNGLAGWDLRRRQQAQMRRVMKEIDEAGFCWERAGTKLLEAVELLNKQAVTLSEATRER